MLEHIFASLKRIRLNKLWLQYTYYLQAKFAYGGSILGLSQFSPLPQLPQKLKLTSKVIKKD
jgi:hypothetical protein